MHLRRPESSALQVPRLREPSSNNHRLVPAESTDLAAFLARLLLYTYAFMIPFESALALNNLLGSGAKATVTKVYGILIGAMIVTLRPFFFLSWTWPCYVLAAWLGWGIISCYLNDTTIVNSVVLNVALALALPCCMLKRRHIETVWLCLAFGGGLAALVSVLSPTYTVDESRLLGLHDLNPNSFVNICNVSLICVIYFVAGFNTIYLGMTLQSLLCFFCPILLYAITATGSRTGWVSLGAALFVSAWLFAPPSPRRWLYRGITLLAAGFVLTIILNNASLSDRAKTGLEGDMVNRDLIWRMAWQLFNEVADPVSGMGLRRADRFLTRYAPDGRWYGRERLDVHNTYLTVLLETGYVGIVLFLIAVVGPTVLLLLRYRKQILGLMAVAPLITILVSSITNTWYIDKLLWLLWACGVSCAVQLSFKPEQRTVSVVNRL